MLPVTLVAALCAADVDGPRPEDVRRALERGVAFLIKDQNRDGSWGGPRNKTFTDSFANFETHHAWMVGTTGLVCMALLEEGAGPEAEAALGRGLDYVVANSALKRPAEWDIDNTWGLIYGLQGVSRALAAAKFASSPRRDALRKAALELLEGLERYQSPNGGWGYYANAYAAWRPEWATSFMTAVAVLAMLDAREAGIPVKEKVLQAAVRAVKRCRLPSSAYTYSVMAVPSPGSLVFINQMKGSLSRIQVCNLAIRRSGEDLTLEEMRRGLDLFFQHHKFLDVGLRKPIPHEAYYFIAAYFYLFGHYYAAQVIEALPAEARGAYWSRLQREIIKTQESDGGMWDFWISSHTKPYGTAFSVLALGKSLRAHPR